MDDEKTLDDEKTYIAHIGTMHCTSCEKILSNALRQKGFNIKSADYSKSRLVFSSSEANLQQVKDVIESQGYSIINMHQENENESCCKEEVVVQKPLNVKSALHFQKPLITNWFLATFLIIGITLFAFYGIFKADPTFGKSLLPILVLAGVSVTSIATAGHHFLSYNKPISCMVGMMEGMTYGMMSGFMIGAAIGATNGMFWGSVFGMLFGVMAGIWGGWRCGVMGIMEGIMAGIMAGSMGAMFSVMLLADPLPIAIAILDVLCMIVLAALIYMEMKELGKVPATPSIISIFATSIVLYTIIALIMIYGPKSGPIYLG